MLLLLVVLLSLVLGALLCLVVQYFLLRRWYFALPTVPLPFKPQYEDCTLPQVLLDSLQDAGLQEKKESCVSLNLLLQFLFSELKDTARLRTWVMKRMDIEFDELLMNTTTGKLLDKISVRDFNLGGVFPVVQHVSVQDVKLKDVSSIEEVNVLVALDYPGGFQLAVDVDMVFGKSAYLSVKITKLQGMARLQFTREPYTHWTFSFVEEPVVEFDVESQFEGRPVAQLTSIITNQIKKSIRKKHTLPNYKIRYKPFFVKPEQPVLSHDIYCHGNKVSKGELIVYVVKCSRLVGLPGDGEMSIYCSLALDKLPWMELMSRKKKQWTGLDLTVDKAQAVSVGLTFKEEFIIDRYEMMVVVEIVTNNSPASSAGVKKGDIVISVNNIKVTSSKHAVRLIKQTAESFVLRVERSSTKTATSSPASAPATGPKTAMPNYKEDAISLMESMDAEKIPDEFVNISINYSDSQQESGDIADSPESAATGRCAAVTGGGDLKNSTLTLRRKSSSDCKNFASTTSISTTDEGYKSAHSKETLTSTKSDPTQVNTSKTEEKEVDLRKTKKVKFGQNPIFRQEFTLQVLDRHCYLNVCVWCSVPEKLDKQNRVLKAERDMLLGHVSIPVMDIALECMNTLQGNYKQTFQLTPAEARAGASRAKFSHLASHRGFDESLCHGDLTLGFIHSTQPMTKAERRKIQKLRRNSDERLVQQQQPQDTLGSKESKRILVEGEHDFVTSKFASSTFCQLCHKKIWFKSGFQCQVCGFISHKKCMNSCQMLTRCSKDGWKFRDSSAAIENAKKAAKLVKSPKSSQPPVSSQAPNTRTSFLERFRRDKGVQLAHKNDVPTPAQKKSKFLQLLDRERSNSLSNRGDGGCDSDHRSAKGRYRKEEANAAGVKKTKSSTSLDDLIKRGSAIPGELSDTDSESEMNLMRYYEQQKNTARSDEMVVTAAKEMGRELYSSLPLVERHQKLDTMINKLQKEIDQESEHRAELSQQQKENMDIQQRANAQAKIDKSDEKIQSLAVLMLHYCAGLQHCMEEMENERTKPDEAEPSVPPSAAPLHQQEVEPDVVTNRKHDDGKLSLDIPVKDTERPPAMSGSVYLDVEEKPVDELSSGEEEDSIFSRQRYETPQVEFERQLSTALQEAGQSDDDDDENPAEALFKVKSDNFSEDHDLLVNSQEKQKRSIDSSESRSMGLSSEDVEAECPHETALSDGKVVTGTGVDGKEHADVPNEGVPMPEEEGKSRFQDEGASLSHQKSASLSQEQSTTISHEEDCAVFNVPQSGDPESLSLTTQESQTLSQSTPTTVSNTQEVHSEGQLEGELENGRNVTGPDPGQDKAVKDGQNIAVLKKQKSIEEDVADEDVLSV